MSLGAWVLWTQSGQPSDSGIEVREVAGLSAPPGNRPGPLALPGGSWKMPWQMLGGKPSRTSRPCSPPHSAFTLPGLVLLQACVSTFPSHTFISMLLSFWELSSENTHISRTASQLNFTFLLFPPDGCLIHIPWQGQSEATANVI